MSSCMYKYKYKLYKVKQADSHTREQVQIAYMVAHYSNALHQHLSVCHVHYTHTVLSMSSLADNPLGRRGAASLATGLHGVAATLQVLE